MEVDYNQHVAAGWIGRVILRLLGAQAIAMPWGRAYYLPGEMTAANVAHENEHLAQIKQDGPLTFSLRYLWWHWEYGYYWNPYEVAARMNSGEQEPESHHLKNEILRRYLNAPNA